MKFSSREKGVRTESFNHIPIAFLDGYVEYFWKKNKIGSIFSLANLGGMTVGGLILGFSSVSLGAQKSLWVVALTMFIVVLIFQISRSLWRPSADASTEVV